MQAYSDWRNRFSPSHRDGAKAAGLTSAAVVVGLVGWSGNPLLLPVATLFPALWAMAPNRLAAALVAGGYFLAASRGLPQGVANFYGSDLFEGLALWFAASVGFVLVHAALWTWRPGWGRALRYGLAAVLMSVPPFGIVGWAHPITAAGILMPGWSWFGLAAAAIGLLVITTRFRPIAILTFGGLWIWSAATWTAPTLPQGWIGVDTEFGGSNGEYAAYQQHFETISRVREEATGGAKVVVLPESALGVWTPTIERLWVRELGDLDIVAYGGAVVVDETGYANVMLELSEDGGTVLYHERMPVPVSMWQPWLNLWGTPAGARADFFANPVISVRGVKVATLICYEQLLIWPILQSVLASPEVLVAPVNGWWTDDTEIVAIQIASTRAWAQLFHLPLVLAINT